MVLYLSAGGAELIVAGGVTAALCQLVEVPLNEFLGGGSLHGVLVGLLAARAMV